MHRYTSVFFFYYSIALSPCCYLDVCVSPFWFFSRQSNLSMNTAASYLQPHQHPPHQLPPSQSQVQSSNGGPVVQVYNSLPPITGSGSSEVQALGLQPFQQVQVGLHYVHVGLDGDRAVLHWLPDQIPPPAFHRYPVSVWRARHSAPLLYTVLASKDPRPKPAASPLIWLSWGTLTKMRIQDVSSMTAIRMVSGQPVSL